MVGKLQGLMSTVAGRNVYLRFNCFAGDAMGMNMVSKGVLAVVDLLQEVQYAKTKYVEVPCVELGSAATLTKGVCKVVQSSEVRVCSGRLLLEAAVVL